MERPVLQKVLRGYDPIQVDALLDSVWPALDGTDALRGEAKHRLDHPSFPVVMRGYDLRQVDALIADLSEELNKPSAHRSPAQSSDATLVERREPGRRLGAVGTPQVARTGDKAGDWFLIVAGTGMIGWALRTGHWTDLGYDAVAVAMFWIPCLGIYRMVTRLTWSPEEICLVTGPWRRRIALQDLSEVSHARTRGMPNIVLRDKAGHKLVISGLAARQADWKPFVLTAAHAAEAELTPGTEFLLNHPDYSG